MPNLAQTTEQTPALIHAGPFANIAHGTSSVLAQRLALGLAEYVINEAGFAADLGAEKYLDIVMPSSGIKPSAAVLVATVRAIRRHSEDQNRTNLKPGLENLAKHIENLRKFALSTVVAINRFPDDKAEDLRAIGNLCAELSVESALAEVFDKGGDGARELGEKVIEAADEVDLNPTQPLYTPNLAIEEKVSIVAKEIYGASGIELHGRARQKLERFTALGFADLPVCIAKTQNSLSDNPKKLGAPKGWTLTISDAHLSSGAGFIVAIAGNMLLMPGLGKVPQAAKMRVNESGEIEGLS